MKRAAKTLVDARVNDLVTIILDGAVLEFDLCEFVREREKEAGSPWHLGDGETPLSYSQIRRYAARAQKVIHDTTRTSRKRLLRTHVARRQHLYAKAVNQGDLRAAAAILKDLAELQGLYPPRKIAPTNPKGDKPYAGSLTEDERLAALQALYARVGARGGGPLADGPDGADGPLLGGPGPDNGRRGHAARPLASPAAADGAEPDVAPLFPPGG
jgi:hypothetical protein